MVCPLTALVFAVLVGTVAGTSSENEKKRSRNQLTTEQRLWLCDRKRSTGESHTQLAAAFDQHFKVDMKLSKGTISGILKDLDKWKAAAESYAVENKKLRLAHEPKLEEALVLWKDIEVQIHMH